jgi:hypothetical protein
MFHAATLELPVGMVQSVGDAVILSVATDDLRQVLPVPMTMFPRASKNRAATSRAPHSSGNVLADATCLTSAGCAKDLLCALVGAQQPTRVGKHNVSDT